MEFFDRVKAGIAKDVELTDDQIRAVIDAVITAQDSVRFENLAAQPRVVMVGPDDAVS